MGYALNGFKGDLFLFDLVAMFDAFGNNAFSLNLHPRN